MALARNRVRVGGSGFTVFTWDGKPIAFAQQISHTSPQGVGTGPVAIHPMDEPYPVQVVTPAAAGMGTLVLRLFELYGQQVWERLGAEFGVQGTNVERYFNQATDSAPLAGAIDLVDIFIRIAEQDTPIGIVKYIKPPKLRGQQMAPYTEEYHNCVITNVADGEMEVTKDITVAYTHMTRGGRGSKAWEYRDGRAGHFDVAKDARDARGTGFSTG
jgi:hypothetical protein